LTPAARGATVRAMDKKFEEIDHSGDVGIEAFGLDGAEALENATYGLFSLMVYRGVSAKLERVLTVDAGSDEDMVVDWLSEVISAASMNGELYCGVQIERTGPHSVRGVVRGELIDASRHELRFEVKAATYHGLEFERTSGGCRVRVIFDL
jgi:SHS2 domain-containing protein